MEPDFYKSMTQFIQFILPFIIVAAAWGGSRAGLNGTKKTIARIEATVDGIAKNQLSIISRVGVLEGKQRK